MKTITYSAKEHAGSVHVDCRLFTRRGPIPPPRYLVITTAVTTTGDRSRRETMSDYGVYR